MLKSAILTIFSLFACSYSALPAGTLAEANWPQWRGPLATGAAPQAHPPTTWSETNNVRWKIKLPGNGTATPIVWGDQIFIQTAIATGKKAETPAEKALLAIPQVAAQVQPGTTPRRRPPAAGGGGGMRSEKPIEA